MITIKRLTDISLSDAAEAGTIGFQDYYVPIAFTTEQLSKMIETSFLSTDFSFIAYYKEKPIGLLLSGIRTVKQQKIAWVGGLAVSPKYRRLGVAQKLMSALMDVYEQEQVNIATLECFSVNTKALDLYKKFGYKEDEKLLFLENKGTLSHWKTPETNLRVENVEPQQVSRLSFYQHSAPWKTHWDTIANGKAIIVYSAEEPVGYALYEHKVDALGKINRILLYHCVTSFEQNKESVIQTLLSHAFMPLDESCIRTTFNMPESNKCVAKLLLESGFKYATTKENIPLEQTNMVCKR